MGPVRMTARYSPLDTNPGNYLLHFKPIQAGKSFTKIRMTFETSGWILNFTSFFPNNNMEKLKLFWMGMKL